MKFKHKSLILGSTAIIGLCPTASLITSCHKITLDEAINNIKNSIISEFQWICTHYRNTFCNKYFCDALAKRITKMGFKVIKDWDVEHDCPKSGSSHYHPDVKTAHGYNMYFDIPANGMGAAYPMIALQAHTDMVCVVATDSEGKPYDYDWSKGVIPVTEEETDEATGNKTGKIIMHSKDYKTTLGADDGAGVATILAFAKHWKDFNHGRIRCIFTVDEEDGESGAKYMDKTWLDDLDYYLSLDGEKSHINWNYSAGAQQACYVLTEQTDPTVGEQEYTITISGLKGGHSGLGIKEGHLHPLLVVGDILTDLTSAGFTNVRLAKCWDNLDPTEKPNGGSIPTGAKFVVQFGGTSTEEQISTIVDAALKAAKNKDFQKDFSDSPTYTVVKSTDSTKFVKTGLTSATTSQLASFLTDYVGSKLYYYTLEEGTTFAEEGNNIGGLRVGDECKAPVPKEGEKNTLYIEFFGRSTKETLLNQFLHDDIESGTRAGILYKAIDSHFKNREAEGTLTDLAYNLPWIRNDQNPLQLLIHEASEHYNNKLVDEPVFGWLELAEVYDKNAAVQYGIIGPQIEDLHKPTERIYLDSLELMNKLLIYIMQNLKHN